MLIWLQNHIFTILICAVLIAFFGWLLYTLIRDRKQGNPPAAEDARDAPWRGIATPIR